MCTFARTKRARNPVSHPCQLVGVRGSVSIHILTQLYCGSIPDIWATCFHFSCASVCLYRGWRPRHPSLNSSHRDVDHFLYWAAQSGYRRTATSANQQHMRVICESKKHCIVISSHNVDVRPEGLGVIVFRGSSHRGELSKT